MPSEKLPRALCGGLRHAQGDLLRVLQSCRKPALPLGRILRHAQHRLARVLELFRIVALMRKMLRHRRILVCHVVQNSLRVRFASSALSG